MKPADPVPLLHSLRNRLGCHSAQMLFLAAIVVFVFWNSLWGGAPRADQLAYLHQISRYSNFWDILIHSPSWNRTQSAGDFLLFRPILYWQLGLFYYFFRYNFFLWQLASLALHVLVVLGVYLLFLKGSLRDTAYPFLISALFGCSFIGSELVLWSHISGYLTFSALFVFSIFFLLGLLQNGRNLSGWAALFLGFLAQFTYELGALWNLLVGVVLFGCYLKSRAKDGNRVGDPAELLKWAQLFSGVALLYPLASVADLLVRGTAIPLVGGRLDLPQRLGLAFWYTIEQMEFWFGGWLFPSAYSIQAADRAQFSGFHYSVALLFNVVAAAGIAGLMAKGMRRRLMPNSTSNKKRWLAAAVLFFTVLYSFMIACGRALPRGINYVFELNVYYAYIACLCFTLACALYWGGASGADIHTASKSSDLPKEHPHLMRALLLLLIVLNGYYTWDLSSSYRYSYSPQRLEVINIVTQWLEHDGKHGSSYFEVSRSCAGNEELSWFGSDHFRKGSKWSEWRETAAMADILWPEKSFRLNKPGLTGQYRIYELECTVDPASFKLVNQ